MKYDFDEIIPRRGTNSVKWDLATDERVLPMWVADMDFRAAPPVLDALERRLRHGVFGYTKVPDAYFEAVKGWFGKRHGFRIENEWILPTTGVIPALSVILKALTEPGDKVILQTPVYNCFFAVLERTGRQPLANPLIDEGGAYRMDFEDLERKAADPQAKLIFLCNPHNPAGRAWTAEELTRLGEICLRHGVTVISDEIHCDLTDPGYEYTPFASVSPTCAERSVVCIAPTKTFNLAGLQTAALVVVNPALRHKVWRAINTDEIAEPNVFAAEAAVAALTYGDSWLEALRCKIFENKQTVINTVQQELPQLHVISSPATYLLWIDCGKICADSAGLADFLAEKTGLLLNEGKEYGQAGRTFLRMNVAVSSERLTMAWTG